MEKPKKILAVNFGGIGDEILFLPTLISLKKEFPNSKITLALEPRSKSIKDLSSVIDEIITVDIKRKNKYLELLKFIFKARGFDIGVTAGGNKFMSIILWLTGAKRRYGYDTGKLSRLLLTKAVKLEKQQYAVNMYHELVLPITKHKTELPIIDIPVQDKLENSVLIHPGVSRMSVDKGMIKTIPALVWADLVNKLIEKGKHVILAGGPDDAECIDTILKNIKAEGLFDNMFGKTKNLKDLAILIGQAEKFICSDSAPLHIGVAMGTKTYAIFGPTDDKKLIPPSVTPIKANDNCAIKPCLWDIRQTTCESLFCLQISADDIIRIAEL